MLALFILLRGSDSTLLKVLQQAGKSTHAAGGSEVISFCNVFFFSSLVCGLVLVLFDRQTLFIRLPALTTADRWRLALQSFSGFFLGPVAFYLALDRLSVVQFTLISSLTLPCTSLAAWLFLREPLPRRFMISCSMITAGLLLVMNPIMGLNPGGLIDSRGLLWTLLGVAGFAISAVVGRINAQRQLGVGLTLGVNSMAAAVVFALIALSLFGPVHFFYLRLWWVLGVIGGYALVITLGSQLSLTQSYARIGVVKVSFWASLTIVISLVQAHLWLREPLPSRAVFGAFLILLALLLQQGVPAFTQRADNA